ncbi:periplasmic solute binding protein [Rubrobacter xylanophilus DSM 9941]|uniref:Periplasmic solute binding protein n=1 Tax=Rubrobacter xylanophilus (strain DSM 9941 / JCM 11954 / NBRC 16129 / PRD-1) TaxID=266117 RepID=Q1AWX1_RUBXD|nr:metal ABC transporter substrate-binding protein [Rubrobacter xylanophilus]ABG04107.1 periplasmic solute binding protein [Rubrobacter xylanophilus DSM 9941]
MPLRRALLAPLLLLLLAAGCAGSSGEGGGGRPEVAATTPVIGDLVRQVAGGRAEVFVLVPPGAEPHTFQPAPRDAARLSRAEAVFKNGLGLDDWVDDLIESAGGEGQTVVELSRGLEPVGAEHGHHDEEEHGHHGGHARGNPHFWLDVRYAMRYVERIRDALIRVDPGGEEVYRENARRYLRELERLDRYIRERAGSIPEERRKLVTFHDAFPYFARAYGFEEVAVVLPNPNAEPGSRQVARVVRVVREEGVPAIFTEPQFNFRLARTVAEEAGVEVYEIYSDTLPAGDGPRTYEAMMRANIDRIAEALG